MKNKFPILLVLLFIAFSVYSIFDMQSKIDMSKTASQEFSSLAGELRYNLKPYQISSLKRKYADIQKSVENAKQSLQNINSDSADTSGISDTIYQNPDVLSKIKNLNKALNEYSKKYLSMPEDEVKDIKKSTASVSNEDSANPKEEKPISGLSDEESQVQKLQLHLLKDILSQKDYDDISKLVAQMNEENSYQSPDMKKKMLNILTKYKDLDCYLILNQLCARFNVLSYYELENNELVQKSLKGVSIEPASAFEQSKYRSLVNMELLLLDGVHLKYFKGFFVFKDNDKNQLAYAGDFQNNQKGYLGIDAQDFASVSSNEFERKRFYESTIDELARVILLSSNQIDYSKSDDILDVDDFKSIKPYAKKDSYLLEFYQRFYSDLLYEDALASYKSNDPAAINAFYLRHYYEFMSPLQVYDPFIDMLKSMSYFMLEDRPAENTVKDQKIRFFYEFTELSDLKKRIQLNIKNLEE